VEIYRKTTKDFNILHYLNDSTINFTPAFHEKVKEQLPAEADMCFDKVNNDD